MCLRTKVRNYRPSRQQTLRVCTDRRYIEISRNNRVYIGLSNYSEYTGDAHLCGIKTWNLYRPLHIAYITAPNASGGSRRSISHDNLRSFSSWPVSIYLLMGYCLSNADILYTIELFSLCVYVCARTCICVYAYRSRRRINIIIKTKI